MLTHANLVPLTQTSTILFVLLSYLRPVPNYNEGFDPPLIQKYVNNRRTHFHVGPQMDNKPTHNLPRLKLEYNTLLVTPKSNTILCMRSQPFTTISCTLTLTTSTPTTPIVNNNYHISTVHQQQNTDTQDLFCFFSKKTEFFT